MKFFTNNHAGVIFRSSGSDELSAIRLEDISAHSEMSDNSQTPALRLVYTSSVIFPIFVISTHLLLCFIVRDLSGDLSLRPSAAPFSLKKNPVFTLRNSSGGVGGSSKDVVAAAVASALHLPASHVTSSSGDVAMNTTDYEEEEEDLRL